MPVSLPAVNAIHAMQSAASAASAASAPAVSAAAHRPGHEPQGAMNKQQRNDRVENAIQPPQQQPTPLSLKAAALRVNAAS